MSICITNIVRDGHFEIYDLRIAIYDLSRDSLLGEAAFINHKSKISREVD